MILENSILLNENKNKGFTLVEIAIVITIIAMLIGGILKGSAMIINAQITASITSIKGVQAANKQFRQQYGYLAGDVSNAETTIANCNASTNCTNGDGNNRLDAVNSYSSVYTGGPTSSGSERERWLFWKHLALSNHISGIDISDNGTLLGLPSIDIGGVLTIGQSNGTTSCGIGGDFRRGLWVSMVINATSNCTSTNAFESAQISAIDRKMDDGMPDTGTVRAGSSGNCTTTVGGKELYSESDKLSACNGLYYIE